MLLFDKRKQSSKKQKISLSKQNPISKITHVIKAKEHYKIVTREIESISSVNKRVRRILVQLVRYMMRCQNFAIRFAIQFDLCDKILTS